MADIVSPEKRSQNMSALRSKNTKPEVYLRKLLFAQGYRYRIADKSVPGHPDIFLRKVYLNKKLLHDIVKYTRYSVLFKYTTTTYSSAFNIVSYLQATFSRFKRQISDKFQPSERAVFLFAYAALLCFSEQRHINGLHCLDFTFRKYMTVGVKRGFGSAVPQSVCNHTGGNIGVNEQ